MPKSLYSNLQLSILNGARLFGQTEARVISSFYASIAGCSGNLSNPAGLGSGFDILYGTAHTGISRAGLNVES